MGIKGLLPCLQSITRPMSLERYRGLTVAVDAMSWLHKGIVSCDVKALAHSQRSAQSERPAASELACILFTTNKAEILKTKFGMNVVLVIDGDTLPAKKVENEVRHEDRDKAFQKAILAEKDRDNRAARRYYAQACSITYKIRHELIKRCKVVGIPFLVAPYEADAQMARLAQTGFVDLVITEDSDILVYGCPRALFKIDFSTFQGMEIQLMRDMGKNAELSFRNWTHDMFVFMCIISGCDYCQGLPGVGIKLAHKLVRVHRTPSKIFSALKAAGRMPSNFEEQFLIAFRTFRHQRVFCTSKEQIETLLPIDGLNCEHSSRSQWSFLGEYIEPEIARKIADGSLHPSIKLGWDEAFKRQQTSNPASSRRISNESSELNSLNDAKGQESNVWYTLVYGSTTRAERENICRPSSYSDNNERSMFSFFPKRKDHSMQNVGVPDKAAVSPSNIRPPLQEIYVGTNHSTLHPKTSETPVKVAHHKDIPIHFNDYVSQLVGKTFEPISRKRKKMENDGTKSLMFVKKIWENRAQACPLTYNLEHKQTDKMEIEEDNCVSRFKTNPTQITPYINYGSGECQGIDHRSATNAVCERIQSWELPHQVVYDDTIYKPARNFTENHNGQNEYFCVDGSTFYTSKYSAYHHDELPQSQLLLDSPHRNHHQYSFSTSKSYDKYDDSQRQDDLHLLFDSFQQRTATSMEAKRSINSYIMDDDMYRVMDHAKQHNYTGGCDIIPDDRRHTSTTNIMAEHPSYFSVPIEFQQLRTIRKPCK